MTLKIQNPRSLHALKHGLLSAFRDAYIWRRIKSQTFASLGPTFSRRFKMTFGSLYAYFSGSLEIYMTLCFSRLLPAYLYVPVSEHMPAFLDVYHGSGLSQQRP